MTNVNIDGWQRLMYSSGDGIGSRRSPNESRAGHARHLAHRKSSPGHVRQARRAFNNNSRGCRERSDWNPWLELSHQLILTLKGSNYDRYHSIEITKAINPKWGHGPPYTAVFVFSRSAIPLRQPVTLPGQPVKALAQSAIGSQLASGGVCSCKLLFLCICEIPRKEERKGTWDGIIKGVRHLF
jgi:hypothetical protein